jgi:hypothetical protein
MAMNTAVIGEAKRPKTRTLYKSRPILCKDESQASMMFNFIVPKGKARAMAWAQEGLPGTKENRRGVSAKAVRYASAFCRQSSKPTIH